VADTTISPPASSLEALLALLRDRLTPPPAELLSRESFALMLDIGTSTLDRLLAAGAIGPKAFKVGPTALRWERREVQAWLTHRDQGGELYDRSSWPAVWDALKGCRTK
jgi:predicted DNA-binding transcriptional regulator AlpA